MTSEAIAKPLDVSDVYLGVVELIAAAVGMQSQAMMMPVMEGNHLTILSFRRRHCCAARIGDTIPVLGGGMIQRVSYDGWVQWRFIEGARFMPMDMIPKVLREPAVWLRRYFRGEQIEEIKGPHAERT